MALRPYYQDDYATIYHGDCEDLLGLIPKVDLVLTDPPYGINAGDQRRQASRTKLAKATDYGENEWDIEPVKHGLLWEWLCRGEFAICFGGNYYALRPARGWLVWDKDNGESHFADCELAWTNLPQSVRRLRYRWNGMLQEPGREHEKRVHPTQKPLEVISWCLSQADKHARRGLGVQTILDPFMGSGTVLRVAKDRGRQGVGIEREERYCEVAAKRLSQEVLPLSGEGA